MFFKAKNRNYSFFNPSIFLNSGEREGCLLWAKLDQNWTNLVLASARKITAARRLTVTNDDDVSIRFSIDLYFISFSFSFSFLPWSYSDARAHTHTGTCQHLFVPKQFASLSLSLESRAPVCLFCDIPFGAACASVSVANAIGPSLFLPSMIIQRPRSIARPL